MAICRRSNNTKSNISDAFEERHSQLLKEAAQGEDRDEYRAGNIFLRLPLIPEQCAIARTLFKSWFIDDDPVRARAEGRAPAGMDAKTAAMFHLTNYGVKVRVYN